MKGRICANGAPHQKFVPKEEAEFLTITLEGILVTMMIDAYEYRKVENFGIPAAYLQTDLPTEKFTLLLMEGNFMDIMCDINPNYKKHVKLKTGRKNWYLRILKAIYGMIKCALLWYELYMSVLKNMLFRLNPYGMCVANNDINGKHCTIAWYVDDNKVSHVEQNVTDDLISKVEERSLGLTVTKGNVYILLGMKKGTSIIGG